MKLPIGKVQLHRRETWKLLVMVGSLLIYVLLALALTPSGQFFVLALLPVVVGAYLEGIAGGTLMALGATLSILLSISLKESYPWPDHQIFSAGLVLAASWITAIGLGWITSRERERQDIQNRQHAKAEEELEWLSAVLKAATDAVIAVDEDGNVILLNPAAERTFNLKSDRLLNAPLSSTMSGEPIAGLFLRAMHRGQPLQQEISTLQGRTLNASLSPVQGVGWVAVMQDITRFKEMEQMKDEMLSTVSHDLRNPITSIQGFVDLISLVGPVNEKQAFFIGKVKKATAEMGSLINGLLDIAWIESGMEFNKEPCAVPDLIETVAHKFQDQAAQKKLSLQTEITDDLPQIRGDPERLRQALSNLVINAIRYTPEGGQVTVRGQTQNGQVIMEVKDSGIGISASDLPKIFDRFFRAENEFTQATEGTGLGLGIAKTIVEKHGGEITVESQPDEGSTFRIALPPAS